MFDTHLNIVTELHVLQVICMHSLRTVHKFTKDFLLQYLFSSCDKLLRKGGGGGENVKT